MKIKQMLLILFFIIPNVGKSYSAQVSYSEDAIFILSRIIKNNKENKILPSYLVSEGIGFVIETDEKEHILVTNFHVIDNYFQGEPLPFIIAKNLGRFINKLLINGTSHIYPGLSPFYFLGQAMDFLIKMNTETRPISMKNEFFISKFFVKNIRGIDI
ncbi:MAG: hypothetical protein OXB84_02520, partial [Halobacteriovoraceae bacterium]|nr:hypothetical protein [Halobacteriovoraceae bacterium]